MRLRAILVPALLAFALVGCEPRNAGEQPAPGSIHLVSEPPQAPYPVILRYLSGGGVSRAYHEFAQGETMLVVFSSLPGVEGIQVNGRECEGRYTLETRVETDLVLVLGDGTCRVQVIGSHPEGAVHSDPPTDPKVDGQ